MQKQKPAKKSETLEIRLPYAAKTAFMARCRAQGRTASEAVRLFVESEIAPEPRPRPRWGLRLAIGGAAAVALAAAAAPSIARTDARADFAQLDRNADGRVGFDELSAGGELQLAVGRTRAAALTDADTSRLRTLVLKAVFTRLDADHDGGVDFQEYSRSLARIRPDAGTYPSGARSKA